MKMINDSNEVMEIQLTESDFNIINKVQQHSCLKASIVLQRDTSVFRKELDSLKMDELERMVLWLRSLLEKAEDSKEFYFSDRHLKIKLMTRSKIPVLKFIYQVDETNREVWELFANENNISELISELQTLIKTDPILYIGISEQNINRPEPLIIIKDYPDLKKNKILSRDFKTPYRDMDEEIAGNLYNWLHQSYSVLWEVDTEKNEIILFSKTNEKLGLRFATLLKMEKEVAIDGVFEMSKIMALTNWTNDMILKNKLNNGLTINLYNLTFDKRNKNFNKIVEQFERMFGNEEITKKN